MEAKNTHLIKLREMKELMDLINPPPVYIERIPELRKKKPEDEEPRSSRSRLWRTKKIIDYTNPIDEILVRKPQPKPEPSKAAKPPRSGGRKAKKVEAPPEIVAPPERRVSFIDSMPNILWNFDQGKVKEVVEIPKWMEPLDTTGFFEPRYDLLPMELILIIFKQITTSDRLAAGETCCRWNEASHYYEPFLDQTYYHFDRVEFGDQVVPFKYFSKGFRYYPRLVFTQVEFNKHSDFWEVHGLWITELTLRSCVIRKKKFLSIMRNLLNLRRLELMQCDELFKNWTIEYNTQEPMFPFFLFCLKHLSLSGCDYFNEFHFERFITMAPNLQSIDVSNCFINLYLSKRITMLERVMKLISRNRHHMKCLNLTDTPCVDDFTWHCLCDIEGLRLTHFTMAYSERVPLKDPGIIRFFTIQTELTHLDLTSSIGLNDECMQIIITSCPLLHTLKIRRCWLLSDEGVVDMHTLQHLRVLDISSCERISDFGINTYIVGKRHREMHEIYLSLLNNLSDSTLYYIIVTFRNLQILDLDSTANSVTDEVIQYTICYLHNLRHLNVIACTKLLVKILEYLPVADRRTASMACWRWYEASKYLGFVRKMCLHLVGVEFDDFTSPVADLLQSSFCFPVLKLTRVKLNVYSKFWAKFGPFIQEITFEKCMIWRERVISVFKYMPNLRIARFIECDLLRDDLFLNWKFFENGVVKIYFPSIEHLSLSKNAFSELQFNAMVDMMPNLTEVDFSNCFRNVDPTRKAQLLNCILTFIQHRQNELKSLNLRGVPVDDIFLRGMVSARGFMLEELTFTYLEKIPRKLPAIIELLQRQTEIRVLDLSQSTGITDYCIDQIVRNMLNLRVMKLAGCCGVSDYGVAQIFKLRQLEVIDLSKCRITKRGIMDGASHSSKTVLHELHLELLSPLDDECIVKISASFANLKILNMGGSISSMTDIALQHIFYNLIHLEQLNLERSTKLTDAGFTGIDLPQKTFAIWDIEETFSIDRLKKLRVLKVSGCYKLTDFSLRYAFRFMELKELNLSRCHQLSKQGIEKLVTNCPALEYLDLSECPNINDCCVELIAQNLKRLSTLKLANCPLVSEVGLSYLSEHCKNLKYLYVRGCFKLPPDISERLANISTLRQVYKS
nr:uncharacterized protein LOC109418895 isoform X3 [Aedes albopictus]